MTVGSCCVCHQAIGTLFHTYLLGVGFFLPGKEPRTCEECRDVLATMTEQDRRSHFVLSGFEFQESPPSGGGLADEISARDTDIRARAKRLLDAELAERARLGWNTPKLVR